MDSLNKLTEYFREFPGIGPRQARRFAYFLLTKSPSFADELARLVVEIKKSMRVCESCFRFYPGKNGGKSVDVNLCSICSDPERNHSELIVVARDVDLEAVEKSGTYEGVYFVLGGTVPILEKNPESRIRSRELLKKIEAEGQNAKNSRKISEIILSLSATPEGEHTEEIMRSLLKPLADKNSLKISVLGRGLSTGAELEYSDADTIKNALKNRA
jgi:recombination protein RecR